MRASNLGQPAVAAAAAVATLAARRRATATAAAAAAASPLRFFNDETRRHSAPRVQRHDAGMASFVEGIFQMVFQVDRNSQ